MAYRKRAHDTYALPSNSDYHVELRRLSLLDAQEIQRAQYGGMRTQLGQKVNEIALKDLDGRAAVMEILRSSVVSWNLDEELSDGRVVPLQITDETLADLEPEDMEFIVHTAVKGTVLEDSFGKASIRVQETGDSPNGATQEEADNLFTFAASQP